MDTEELYDRIYRYCYMKTRHPQTAEDLTQETFLRFLRAHSFEECGKNAAYFYTVARNLCTDFYRSKKTEPLERADEMRAEDCSEDQTTRIVLEEALKQLPQEEQELLFLRYTNEISAGETAKIFGISRFAVYRLAKRALNRLRYELKRRECYE